MTKRFTTLISNTSRFLRTLKRVVILAWRVSPRLYLVQLLLNVISGLVPLLTAFLSGMVVTELTLVLSHPGSSLTTLYEIVLALAVAQLASNQLGYLESYCDDLYGLKFDGYVQEQLIRKFGELDQTYYDDSEFNNRLNKINQHTYAMRSLSGQSFTVLSGLVQVTATSIALISLQPLLIPVILLALIPIAIIEVRTSIKRWRYWDARGENFRLQWYLSRMLLDVTRIREIKLYGLVDWFTRRWRTAFEASRQGQLAIERYAQRQRAFAGILDAIIQVSIQVWLIALIAKRGLAGIGQFVFYRQAIQNFSTAGATTVRMLHAMQENSLYVDDYFEMLALKPRLTTPAQPVALPDRQTPPQIEFRDVSYRYPDVKTWAIRHFNLTIKAGEDIALVGENGAGKTTFVKLLMRLYDPTEGQILVNGTDLRELGPEQWNASIGVLFQDFNKYGPFSFRENVIAGNTDIEPDEAALIEAVSKSGSQTLVQKYDTGLDQILTKSFSGGVDLSGGQWQRVALARAFYRDAPILVLDEPTSAIDAKGEYEIFQEIAASQHHKTTIIISHRFSTVRNAHRIIVLEHGSITEQGTHDELLNQNGMYKELFELQAAGYR